MRTVCWLALGLLATSGEASAQYVIGDIQYTCPVGASWNDPRCIRQPVNNDLGSSANQIAEQAKPIGEWKTTWGAIAISSVGTGDVGVTVGKFSKRDATDEAIKKCEATSGSPCQLSLAYENQCAAIAWPSRKGEPTGGTPAITGGPSLEDVTQRALTSCDKLQAAGECKIIYSECTKPVLEKF